MLSFELTRADHRREALVLHPMRFWLHEEPKKAEPEEEEKKEQKEEEKKEHNGNVMITY